jgi:gliding motility-associated-like protein
MVTAVISGGASPYQLSWKGTAQKTATISGLAPGIYELMVTDTNGCTFVVTAEVMEGNCPPVAVNDSFKTFEDEPISGSAAPNDFDRQNEALTFTISAQPKNGNILFNSDGSFTYTPNMGFWGIETIPYRVCNTSRQCANAVISIEVIPYTIVNLTPTVSSVSEGKKVSVSAKLVKPYKDDVIIRLVYSGKAGRDRDYILLDQFQQIIIPKGKLTTTEEISIAALTDNLEEGDESIIIEISTTFDINVRIGTGATVIIKDIYPPAPEAPLPATSVEIPPNKDIQPDPLFSPNGDGQGNEFFNIENIVSYPDNEVIIFNRWGNEVFRLQGYNQSDRVFKGIANTGLLTNKNTSLVNGVYYYLITTRRPVNGVLISSMNKGYLILKR